MAVCEVAVRHMVSYRVTLDMSSMSSIDENVSPTIVPSIERASVASYSMADLRTASNSYYRSRMRHRIRRPVYAEKLNIRGRAEWSILNLNSMPSI